MKLFGRPNTLSLAEWIEGMRALDAEMPLPKPKFRTKALSKGAPGISTPLPRAKVEVMKRRSK